jgi:hypothetical protein
MTLPALLTIARIQQRLDAIFPAEQENRAALVNLRAARVVYVFLYGGMVEGADRYLGPKDVYRFTESQARNRSESARDTWYAASRRPHFRLTGRRWYADNTREPIRDETIRNGLVRFGCVGQRHGVATTSSKPIYYLTRGFAALFDPDANTATLRAAIVAWRDENLSAAARTRATLAARGRTRRSDAVRITLPDGGLRTLAPGPSSRITKSVVEEFAPRFLRDPALLWMSESVAKVNVVDDELARAINLSIDAGRVLPDIILVDRGTGAHDVALHFIEVVATDGPMTSLRRDALLQYVRASEFPEAQCFFGTAFLDRGEPVFRKSVGELSWGSYVWFSSEPDGLVCLFNEPFFMSARDVRPQGT